MIKCHEILYKLLCKLDIHVARLIKEYFTNAVLYGIATEQKIKMICFFNMD